MNKREYKYVIIQDPTTMIEVPIILCPVVSHDNIKGNIISAGKCKYDYKAETWQTYGDSFTLKVSSRSIDSEILNEWIPLKQEDLL